MSTLKEKFENIELICWDEYGSYESIISQDEIHKCTTIAEEFAIEFADWIMDRGFHFNVWPTTKELLEIYKKEKL